MRGTLHLIPAEDLPVFTAAMQTRWTRVRNSWLKFVQLSEPSSGPLSKLLVDALDGQVLTREELISKVAKGRPAHIREVIKSAGA